MGHSYPSGVPSILPLLGVTKALEEMGKREAGSQMEDTRENGGTDDFDDASPFATSLCFSILGRAPRCLSVST
jgi:hypothetical protein